MKVVKVTTNHEGHLGIAVAAHVSGTWAAHRDTMESDDWQHCEQLWTVSDTRSGLAAVKNIDERDAVEIVRKLGRSIRSS